MKLNLCPTPRKGYKWLHKKNKTQSTFQNSTTTRKKKDVIQFIKNSSKKKWIPKETHHAVATFIEAFNKELKIEEKLKKQLLKATSPKKWNRCSAATKSKRWYYNNKIRQGRSSSYNRRLNNTDFYKKILNDPTESNRNKVNNTIKQLKLQRLLDDKTTKNL